MRLNVFIVFAFLITYVILSSHRSSVSFYAAEPEFFGVTFAQQKYDTNPPMKGKYISVYTDPAYTQAKVGRVFEIKPSTPSNLYLFVFHDMYGLNAAVEEEAYYYFEKLGRRVNVLALDMYDGKESLEPEEAAKLMFNISKERAREIIRACVRLAPEGAKIATIGWSLGGVWSFDTGIYAYKKHVGSILYYSMPILEDEERIMTLNGPVLGIFGKNDPYTKQFHVNQLSKILDKYQKEFHIRWYEAGYQFADPLSVSYDSLAAAQAREESINFLKGQLFF